MQEADIIVATTGVKGLIKPEWIKKGHLILALTNPEPEIEPEVALERGARFAADGKSVNNVLGFPGLFKGALEAGATEISEAALIKAAEVIHQNAPKGQLVPNPLDTTVHEAVAKAVASTT
jgi:malate dehydrogenase (oxaloacetate-decarboxylating)